MTPPRYGSASLSDLMPSVLALLGTAGEPDVVGLRDRLDGVRRCCVVLVDGLGSHLLRANPESAPFLTSMVDGGTSLDAGFPTTTATSLASLGTGTTPGSHGMLGYQVLDPDRDVLVNGLRWDPDLDPRRWQTQPTAFERGVAAGIDVARVGPQVFDGSGLTEAALRGGRYLGAEGLEPVLATALMALDAGERSLVYAYWGRVDQQGHVTGVASTEWLDEVSMVDSALERMAALLPSDTALVVTADHGMVDVDERVDVDVLPELRHGVRHLAGEPRARYVHAEPGAHDDVLATWRAVLGGGFDVLGRDEAIARGWFGPTLPQLSARIGDVVAVPLGSQAIVATVAEPLESSLVGYHGAMTPTELEVPLAVVRGRRP